MTFSQPDADALIPYLESRTRHRFDYSGAKGSHDCARFVGGGVKAVHGVDPLKVFAGNWTTEIGAARVIRRFGGLAAAVDTVMDRIDLTAANRGDVGLTADDALVIFEGAGVVGVDDRGQVRLPRQAVVAAWTVRRG